MTSEIQNLPTPTSEYRVRVHDENRGTERSGRWPLVTAHPVLWDRVTRDEAGPYQVGLNPVIRGEGRQVVLVEGDSLLGPNSIVGTCMVGGDHGVCLCCTLECTIGAVSLKPPIRSSTIFLDIAVTAFARAADSLRVAGALMSNLSNFCMTTMEN